MNSVSFGNEYWKFKPLNTVDLKLLVHDNGIRVQDCMVELKPMSQVIMPEPDNNEGSYAGSVTVELTTETIGADIYYTIDGSTPTSASTLYTEGIYIFETTTLKAIAIKTGLLDSDIFSGTYTIT